MFHESCQMPWFEQLVGMILYIYKQNFLMEDFCQFTLFKT